MKSVRSATTSRPASRHYWPSFSPKPPKPFAPETVQRYVLESYAGLLRTSSVKAHLAVNTTRFATERLTALAQAKGAIDRQVPEVLFRCEQNAGRSQMAAVLTNALAGGAVHVRSAGSAPAQKLNSFVVAHTPNLDGALNLVGALNLGSALAV